MRSVLAIFPRMCLVERCSIYQICPVRFAYLEGRAFRHGDIVRFPLQSFNRPFFMNPTLDAGRHLVRSG